MAALASRIKTMRIESFNIEAGKPYCVFGVVDNERGREIEKEMREWLEPEYSLYEVWHDGTLFEQPALRFMQDLCKTSDRPALYIHTKGAFNRQELSDRIREMWKREFTIHKDTYFDLVARPFGVVACPATGSDKTTWYNGFVANARAMAEIPLIEPNKNRMKFERLFIGQSPQVIGVLRNDFHRERGHIDSKMIATLNLYK